jgi:pimeloyl-ACP methyl ester carboxylesterase
MSMSPLIASVQLNPPEAPRWLGIMPNKPHQRPDSVVHLESYSLAILEFDDQGRCYDRRQMAALPAELPRLNGGDAIIIVFVHGWKHDGRSNDKNLDNFLKVLENVASQRGLGGPPVLGVFIAWRGLSLFGLGLENITFWDRKQAGLRVSMGAPRELFGRLREFRRRRQEQGGVPLLVIIGHSFGGMIVYSALAQSLIEAASTPAGEIVPSFADLVLLANPAFEAVRYLPIHDLMVERDKGSYEQTQGPVFVSVTAINDLATRLAFPLGMAIALVQERTRGREERQALIHTMGHLPWMRTHALSTSPPANTNRPSSNVGGTWLERVQFDERNPFWVVSASPEVVDGHNGIWTDPFRNFAQALVTNHMQRAHAKRMAAMRLQASMGSGQPAPPPPEMDPDPT